MSKFPTQKIANLPAGDEGVSVQDALSLIRESKYYDAIYSALRVEDIEGDFIRIPGAATLVDKVDTESKKYVKFDVNADYQGLKFKHLDDENAKDDVLEVHFAERLKMEFPHLVGDAIKDQIQNSEIKAIPKYSAQSTLLESLYGMNKYAGDLAGKTLRDIVLKNLVLLEQAHRDEERGLKKHNKWYRLLRDEADGQYYFRALITDVYKDYNIAVSVFIALVSLHKIIKASNNESEYNVRSFEYNESYINCVFESGVSVEVPGVGIAKFLVELTNSEITQGAVKMNGLCNIISEVGDEEITVSVQSKTRYKSSIISISHKDRPETAIQAMDLAGSLAKVQNELFTDLATISSRRPDKILFQFREKIRHSRTITKGNRDRLYAMLEQQVANFHELLKLVGKAEELVESEGFNVLGVLSENGINSTLRNLTS